MASTPTSAASTGRRFRGDRLFTPDRRKTLAELGFKHKSLLRWRTPGLEGLHGSFG
jgi:phenol/toluene 2-monooxygenase (NADH) P4/A4